MPVVVRGAELGHGLVVPAQASVRPASIGAGDRPEPPARAGQLGQAQRVVQFGKAFPEEALLHETEAAVDPDAGELHQVTALLSGGRGSLRILLVASRVAVLLGDHGSGRVRICQSTLVTALFGERDRGLRRRSRVFQITAQPMHGRELAEHDRFVDRLLAVTAGPLVHVGGPGYVSGQLPDLANPARHRGRHLADRRHDAANALQGARHVAASEARLTFDEAYASETKRRWDHVNRG